MRASYPTYKSTSIPWLPEMPEHWEQRKNKYLFRRSKSLVGKDFEKYPVLSLTMNGVIRRDLDNPMGKMPATFADYQLIKENTLLFCLFDYDVTPRTVGMVNEKGIVSPAYTSMYPVEKIDLKYYYYWFLMLDERKMLLTHVTNLRNSVSYETFAGLFSPLPPLPEQTAIANYLDAKSEQINRFIAKKEKLIALLKEQKQAIINDAITKGVNESATFQKTESVWFKEIPSHWKTVKFNHYVYLKHGFQFRDFDFKDEGIKVVKISQLKSDGSLDLSECSFIDSNRLNEFKDIKISKDDILMALTGGTIGKIILVSDVNESLLMNYRVGSFYPTKPKELSKEYLFHLLSSNIIFGQIMFAQRETGQPNIGKEDFRKMRFPIPPTISEQDEIVKYIKEQSKNIELIISRVEREIEKVKELKQSLIAEVVTGRIKVA